MSSMYCDRCGQIDQSISIDAILAMDSGPQFSQSVGGIVHDGEYTPVLATHMQGIDTELADLKIRAHKYSSGDDYLKSIGVTQQTIKKIDSAPKFKGSSIMLLSGISIGIFGFVMFLLHWAVGVTCLIVGVTLTIVGGKRMTAISKPIVEASRMDLTPVQKRQLSNVANGSYCRRCNTFSPSHD